MIQVLYFSLIALYDVVTVLFLYNMLFHVCLFVFKIQNSSLVWEAAGVAMPTIAGNTASDERLRLSTV
jgi:hypothetical protein